MNRKQLKLIDLYIKTGIRERKKILEFNKFLKEFIKIDIDRDFAILTRTVLFDIETIEELKELRKELKGQFNGWQDKLENVEAYWSGWKKDYRVTFTWLCKQSHVFIRIDLNTYYKELSEELKHVKKGCGFEEKITPIPSGESKRLSYVCNI